jgi:hypothetical protein
MGMMKVVIDVIGSVDYREQHCVQKGLSKMTTWRNVTNPCPRTVLDFRESGVFIRRVHLHQILKSTNALFSIKVSASQVHITSFGYDRLK